MTEKKALLFFSYLLGSVSVKRQQCFPFSTGMRTFGSICIPLIIFVTLCCDHSDMFRFLLYWRGHTWTYYCKCGLTSSGQSAKIISLGLLAIFLQYSFFDTQMLCWLMFIFYSFFVYQDHFSESQAPACSTVWCYPSPHAGFLTSLC